MGHDHITTNGWGVIVRQKDIEKILNFLYPEYIKSSKFKESYQSTQDYLLGCCSEYLTNKYKLEVPNLNNCDAGVLIKNFFSNKIEFPLSNKNKTKNKDELKLLKLKTKEWNISNEKNNTDNDVVNKSIYKYKFEKEVDERFEKLKKKFGRVSFSKHDLKNTLCEIAKDLIDNILKKMDQKNKNSKYRIVDIEYEEQDEDDSNIMFINVGENPSKKSNEEYYKINIQPPSNYDNLITILHNVPDIQIECEGFISFSYEGF